MSSSSLAMACASGQIWLVEKTLTGAADTLGRTAVINGVAIGFVRVARKSLSDVVNERDPHSANAPVHECCISSQPKCLALLLKTGVCDVKQKGRGGFSPLAFCAHGGSAECLELLLHHMAAEGGTENLDLEESGTFGGGWTLLQEAARHGHYKVVELLIARGANIDQQNDEGNTALHLACLGDKIEAVSALLRLGACKRLRNKAELLPEQCAVSSGCRDLFTRASP